MDYDKMSLAELREEAKNNGIKSVSSLRKNELIELLKKESKSVEKAAQKLEKLAVGEDSKNKEEASKTGAKRTKAKKETEPAEPKAKGAASGTGDRKSKSAGSDAAGRKTKDTDAETAGRKLKDAATEAADRKAKNAGTEAVERKVKNAPVEAADNKASAESRTDRRPAQERPAQTPESNRPSAQERPVQTPENSRPAAQERPAQNTQTAQNNRPGYQQNQGPAGSAPMQQARNQGPDRPVQQHFNNATEGKIVSTTKITTEEREALDPKLSPEVERLDSGDTKMGILEVMPEGFGFIRCDNFLPGENDVYVSPAQIRKFNLKTGDIISGNTKVRLATEKFCALLYIKTINGIHPNEAIKRKRFEELTPVFPHSRIRLETRGCIPALRIVDLLSPIGKGQRGMIVSQPKAGKTTLLKQIAKAMQINYPDLHIIILLIDERPEEVTDMKESIQGSNVEVIYSTFDELPENHKRVSEMAIERAKRLVEHGRDVVVLLDSITRLARAYNLTCQPSGRTLSGGLDPAALHMPKKFFGAARCMREGGSLTILATALVETGSRMDDVVFEEFKGTGNMELVLDRNLSERRIFPAIDLPRSSTRREDLLLNRDEIEANNILRRAFNSSKSDEVIEKIIGMFARTRSNAEFIDMLKNTRL